MITNKIIDILLTITAWAVVPLQLITTFVLGILVNLTFGLLLWPFSLVWMVLFLGPLIGVSYVWERVPFTRLFVSMLGIPLAVIGDIYVSLIPSMGEMDSRIVKMLYCQTFPYTWRFHQFHNRQLNIDSDDGLIIIFQRISKDIAIRQYLKVFSEQNTIDKS
jgi:hypothetical protein